MRFNPPYIDTLAEIDPGSDLSPVTPTGVHGQDTTLLLQRVADTARAKQEYVEAVIAAHQAGASNTDIARTAGVSETAVRTMLLRNGHRTGRGRSQRVQGLLSTPK